MPGNEFGDGHATNSDARGNRAVSAQPAQKRAPVI